MNKSKKIFVFALFFFFLFPIYTFAYQKSVIDITKASIIDLNEALEKEYITSELLVELYLERIDAYNPIFNAVQTVNENAIEEAKRLDLERKNGYVRSQLHGIPILVKSNIDVLGLPTTAGSKALIDNYPLTDAKVIEKLKNAGAIILGTTNMSEFAFSASNSKSSFGNVYNGYNPNYTPLGSSGGSSVSVLLSFASASLGTDTNSSVRLPASSSGIVGLRPTFGLVSNEGVLPYDIKRDTVGVLSKTVYDNKLLFDVIREDNSALSYDLENIKIGVVSSFLEGSSFSGANGVTDKDILKLAQEKISLFNQTNIQLIFIPELLNNYYLNIANTSKTGISFCDGFNAYIKNTTGTIRSFEQLAHANGKIYNLSGYLSGCNGKWMHDLDKVNQNKEDFLNHVLRVMREYDVDLLVYPTIKEKIFRVDEQRVLYSPGSSLGSVIGFPSITVPMGFIDEFSYGLEFFGKKTSEDLLYYVASIFEELNHLEIPNSSLAPNLYEVPKYISSLIQVYEKNQNNSKAASINKKVKTFFSLYHLQEDFENRKSAIDLINLYRNLDQKKEVHYSFFVFILLFLGISFIVVNKNIFINIRKDGNYGRNLS